MTRLISGHMVQGDQPHWEPLLDLVGEDVTGWFMWMFEVELEDGRRVDAYKHQMTRRYVHLTDDGSAFDYAGHDRYRPVDAGWAAGLACGDYPRPGDPE